jgi:hypothetical protein
MLAASPALAQPVTAVINSTTHGKAYLLLTANTSTNLTSAIGTTLPIPLPTQAITIYGASFNTTSGWFCLYGGTCSVVTISSPAAEDEIQPGSAISFSITPSQKTSPSIISSASGVFVVTW